MEIFFEANQDSDLPRESAEFCHNIVWATKPIAQDIKLIDYSRYEGDNGTVHTLFFTDGLMSATLNDIQSKCHLVTIDKGSNIHFAIHLWP